VPEPGSRLTKVGFYIIMAAQFFSALADNALLITAIAAPARDERAVRAL
jgi:hypothetical protein